MELTRNRIAERLSIRSGLPFDQALKACEVIELAMANSLIAKAGELWQRDTRKKPTRFANSALFYRGFGRLDLQLPAGFCLRYAKGRPLVNIFFYADGAFEARLNPNLKPMTKHSRNVITNLKLKQGILVRRRK
jgi:hypothetical protein